MGLSVTTEKIQSHTIKFILNGRLDTQTAHQLDAEAERVVDQDGMVVIIDLSALEYISSAGLRSVFKLKKWAKATGGDFVVLNPTPQVKKVFEIVKAVPIKSIFNSTEELDDYLDQVQSNVLRGG